MVVRILSRLVVLIAFATTETRLGKSDFVKVEDLLEVQKNNSFTIEFVHSDGISDFERNETARVDFYLHVRRKLIEFLNRRRQTTAPTSAPEASSTTTTSAPVTDAAANAVNITIAAINITTAAINFTTPVVTITTAVVNITTPVVNITTAMVDITTAVANITTAVANTTMVMFSTTEDDDNPKNGVILKRSALRSSRVYRETDIRIVDLPKFLANDSLLMSLFLDEDDPNLLEEAIKYLKDSDLLGNLTGMKIKRYYRGLPKLDSKKVVDKRQEKPACLFFLIPLAVIVLVFASLAIFLCLKRRKSYDVAQSKETLTTTNSHNFKGYPKILDDSGWIVPMDQFNRP